MDSGHHQIPIHPDSVEYTAFVALEEQYEFLTMPLGLKNASSVFQRALMSALEDFARNRLYGRHYGGVAAKRVGF